MSATYDPIHEANLIEEIGVLPDRLVGLLAPIALDHHLVQAIKVRWADDGEVLEELLRDGGPIGASASASASVLPWACTARRLIATCCG